VGRLPVSKSDFSFAAVDSRLQKNIYEDNKMESISGELGNHCRTKFRSRNSLILCFLRKFRSLLQSELSTECDLVLHFSVSSKLSLP
jgi:hypothetical protein